MKHILIAFCLILGSVSTVNAAKDIRGNDIPQWYAGLGGSLVFLDGYTTRFNNDLRIFSRSSFKFKQGFGMRAFVGYDITPYFSAEFEMARYGNSVDSQTGVDTSSRPSGTVQKPQTNTALMANAYFHYPNETLFTPYIGAGLGAMHLSGVLEGTVRVIYPDNSQATETQKLSDWVFGEQFMAGVAYEIPAVNILSKSEVLLGYRYIKANDGEARFKLLPGYGIVFENQSSNIDLNWRFYF